MTIWTHLNVSSMRGLFATILFVSLSLGCLEGSAQGEKISVDYNKTSLKRALDDLHDKSGYNFLFNSRLIDGRQPITFRMSDADLTGILDRMLEEIGIDFTIDDKQVVLFPKNRPEGAADLIAHTGQPVPGTVSGQIPQGDPQGTQQGRSAAGSLTVRGLVTDPDGKPLPGASVILKYDRGEPRGVVAGMDGRFVLGGLSEDATLTVSFVGYRDADVHLRGRTSITVVMEPAVETLEDVVVTGYQTLSKERATGSYAVISGEMLKNKLQPSILSRLEGMTAGFTSYKGDYRIRGTATVAGVEEPLYVVDGVPFEGNLNDINPAEVANVTILKDATAASIYGARSTNGVIVITTRGGLANKTVVEYTGTFMITPLQDNRGYRNLMTSAELVDWQQDMFGAYHLPLTSLNPKIFINPVSKALYDREADLITDAQLEKALDIYRSLNNYDQLRDNFLRRSSFNQNHNVSLRGGSDKYRYAVSMNYSENRPYEKAQRGDRIGYNAKASYDFFKWFEGDLTLLGTFSNSDYDNGFVAAPYLTGGVPSYQMIFDEHGQPVKWYMNKSQAEMDRLIALGLYDESFYPLQELSRHHNKNKSSYNNINIGLKFRIIEGLSADVRYQTEMGNGYASELTRKDAYPIRRQINDATQMIDGIPHYLIPTGGYILESRSDWNSYTLRGQVNYSKLIGQLHDIAALAGAERRSQHSTSTALEKYGYDEFSLSHKYIDEQMLSQRQVGTESVDGSYAHARRVGSTFGDGLNRFVAFYANGSYRYDNRFGVTASVRIDQSNLFGTDPKYQYRPLWSVGLSWTISNEAFMERIDWLDYLSLRVTDGINGNIAKAAGPYMITQSTGVNGDTQEYSSEVSTPPNSGLRWERTNQFNVGIDFRVLGNRLGGSIEYYSKNTSDLMGSVSTDPTTGFDKVFQNYGAMYNRGVEVSLDSDNIRTRNLTWTTMLNFSYNRNCITRLENDQSDITSYVEAANYREGQPMNTLYSFRWNSLDRYGAPRVYKADGSYALSTDELTYDDLVNSGTATPPYAVSMTNALTFKGIEFSFLLICYGGHVMREVMAEYITNPEYYNSTGGYAALNRDRSIANYWKTIADSNDPSKSPAINRNAPQDVTQLWYGADRHILDAGYVKLREITLSYQIPARLLRNLLVSNLALRAQVQNIHTWGFNGKGLDPEAWYGTTIAAGERPYRSAEPPTVYTFGVNVTF